RYRNVTGVQTCALPIFHALNATTKMIFLILVSIACMVTYDTRFLIAICILSLILLKVAGIKWKQVSFIVKFIIVFAIINIIAVRSEERRVGKEFICHLT